MIEQDNRETITNENQIETSTIGWGKKWISPLFNNYYLVRNCDVFISAKDRSLKCQQGLILSSFSVKCGLIHVLQQASQFLLSLILKTKNFWCSISEQKKLFIEVFYFHADLGQARISSSVLCIFSLQYFELIHFLL